MRKYEFTVRGRNREATLASVGRTGQLLSVFLPAKLGDPARCQRISTVQHRLLQAVLRETTRKAKKKRQQVAEAEILVGQDVPKAQVEKRGEQKKFLACPLLEKTGHYVGFNGNKARKGRGYLIASSGGWLAKAGYESNRFDLFFSDLTNLAHN